MEEYSVSLRDVHFKYENARTEAVAAVSLDVRKGEMLAILGRNGSGKSTLGKLMNGLFEPAGGSVWVLGKLLDTEEARYWARRECGMVFQDPDNQMVATIVEEDVAFGCENLGIPSEEIQRRVESALKTVGMSDFAQTAPHMLSGGQKQRVAIAGVLAMRPDIIVFDESTSMLDPSGREDIFKLALELNKGGATVVWITHFMEEAARCQRLAVMSEGQIALSGTPREVFAKTDEVRSLGLDVPDMTLLAHMLKAGGLDIPEDILTTEEMEAELCRLASKT